MSHGHEVTRDSDNALLGYVAESGDHYAPLTVFGYPLGPATDFHTAWEVVEQRGLPVLADRWTYRDHDGEWYSCAIQEATTARVVIAITDFGHPDVYAVRAIDAPTEAVLRLA